MTPQSQIGTQQTPMLQQSQGIVNGQTPTSTSWNPFSWYPSSPRAGGKNNSRKKKLKKKLKK